MRRCELKEHSSIGSHRIRSTPFHVLVRAADKRQETYVATASKAFAKSVTIILQTICQCHVVWKWLVLMNQEFQYLLSKQTVQTLNGSQNSWSPSLPFGCVVVYVRGIRVCSLVSLSILCVSSDRKCPRRAHQDEYSSTCFCDTKGLYVCTVHSS